MHWDTTRCLSAGLAAFLANHDPPSDDGHKVDPMSLDLSLTWWSWPRSMAVTDTGITAMLRREGWIVNHKRVQRLWRREGLKVPSRQPKRRRLWLNDGSCIRLRPRARDHVWSYDFVACRTHDGRAFRMLTILDEYSQECLAIEVAPRLNSQNVLDTLYALFCERGVPDHIRSDNGPEFTAHAVREWLEKVEVKTLFIEPGSPWENRDIESFNGRLRDELLNPEIFDTLREAQVLIERWRREYNEVRPHSSLGYGPPAPLVVIPRPIDKDKSLRIL